VSPGTQTPQCRRTRDQVTLAAIEYVETHGLSYATINDVMGALTGALQEFYRRAAAPYEDEAIDRNGDVYGG
jgi:hypothetical protein